MAEGSTATEVKIQPTPEAKPAAPKVEQKPSGEGHQAAQQVETMLKTPDATVDNILRQVADGTPFKGMDAADRIMQQATGPSTEVEVVHEAEEITKDAVAEQQVVQEAETITKQAAETETNTPSKELELAPKQPQQESESPSYEGKTLHQMLDLPENATNEDIDKAFRKASRTLHPDINPDTEEAYKELTKAKTDYDAQQKMEKLRAETAQTIPPSEQQWTRVVTQPPLRDTLMPNEQETNEAAFEKEISKLPISAESVKDIATDIAEDIQQNPDLEQPVTEIVTTITSEEQPLENLQQREQAIQEQLTIAIEKQATQPREVGKLRMLLQIIGEIIKALLRIPRTQTPAPVATNTYGEGSRWGKAEVDMKEPEAEATRPGQPELPAAPARPALEASPKQTEPMTVTLERMDKQPNKSTNQPAIEAAKRPALETTRPKPELPAAPQRPALEGAK